MQAIVERLTTVIFGRTVWQENMDSTNNAHCVAGGSSALLRDSVLQNCASELKLHSQAVVPNLEHVGYGIELMNPKSELLQEGQIKKLRNVYLNPVTDMQDLNGIELPQCTVADDLVAHTDVEHQLGEWCPCKYCGKYYSDQKKLAAHQREDCGNSPGFECPYCCVKIRRKGNLLRHLRKFH